MWLYAEPTNIAVMLNGKALTFFCKNLLSIDQDNIPRDAQLGLDDLCRSKIPFNYCRSTDNSNAVSIRW